MREMSKTLNRDSGRGSRVFESRHSDVVNSRVPEDGTLVFFAPNEQKTARNVSKLLENQTKIKK